MEIKIEIGNWQYNAGIVGLYNILRNNEKDTLSDSKIKVEKNAIIFDSEELEGFEEKYFNYLIDLYKLTLSWDKIVRNKAQVEKFIEILESNSDEFDKVKMLDEINDYTTNVLKKYVTSNSYKAAYELISGDIDPLEEIKSLKPLKLTKKETFADKKDEILNSLRTIKKIIEYFEKEDSRKFIGAKNIIYTIIKNAWDGVCFLNPQSKEKNIYLDYKNYFVQPVNEYLSSDKKKYKYSCSICDREIKDLNNDFNFLVNTGFDIARKSSHVWDFQNDMAMCPICKLVNSCVPAGFTYLFGNGIFINANADMNQLINVNKKLKHELYEDNQYLSGIYKTLLKELREDLKYELEDIQLVRFENNKYYFNLLSKNMIRTITESKQEFENLEKQSFRENGERYVLIDEVMKKILNNENLFSIIHRALYSKISIKEKNYIHSKGLIAMLKINYKMLREVGYMENKEIDIVTRGRSAGRKLRDKYRGKSADHKLSGICYKILNGIKTKNQAMTMDTILNCYLYCKESVPEIITEMLGTDECFREIGYAFVAGLLAVDFEGQDTNKGDEK